MGNYQISRFLSLCLENVKQVRNYWLGFFIYVLFVCIYVYMYTYFVYVYILYICICLCIITLFLFYMVILLLLPWISVGILPWCSFLPKVYVTMYLVNCWLQSKVCFTYLQNPSSVTKEHWSENNQLYSRGLIWRKQIYIVRV